MIRLAYCAFLVAVLGQVVHGQAIRYTYTGTLVADSGNQLSLGGRSFEVTAVVELNAMPVSVSQNADVRTGFIRALSFDAKISGLSAHPTVGFQGIRIQDAINPNSAEVLFFNNSTQFAAGSGNPFPVTFPGVLLSHDVFDATLKPMLIDPSDVLGTGMVNISIPSIGVLNDGYHAVDIALYSQIVPEPTTVGLSMAALTLAFGLSRFDRGRLARSCRLNR